MVARAKEYKIPEKDVHVMHFAFTCTFGAKEPIFSEHHLSLCEENSLLLLRSENESMHMLLHKVENEIFYISFEVKSIFILY